MGRIVKAQEPGGPRRITAGSLLIKSIPYYAGRYFRLPSFRFMRESGVKARKTQTP